MDLSQNVGYSSALKPLMNVAYNVGKTLPQPVFSGKKTVDPSKFGGIVNTVKNVGKSLLGLGTVTTPYQGSTKYEGVHPGIDIANKIGTPIPSNISGKVIASTSGAKQGSPGYGNYVIVQDKYGNQHRYSHLAKGFVKVGQQVLKGMPLGLMGNTGQSYSLSGGTGSHLDYRIRDAYGKYVSPYKFLG
jgi:murein DD-endopeptidase MepM/ murein hydrolase activator NlpD